MSRSITVRGMRSRAQRFLAIDTFEELAAAFRKQPLQLAALVARPEYDEFFIPKRNGKKRLIENPNRQLKKVQRRLNEYLQAVYYFHRTDSAYGFLTVPRDDPSPRHILSNAEAHLGCEWMLNVDMKDFFYQISYERTKQLFEAPLFGFRETVSIPLAAICCYQGRLPMGAPTSPIISNLVSIPLDQDLEELAELKEWVYTRYADDLTFSSKTPITHVDFLEIEQWVRTYDLMLNPQKIRFFSPEGPPKEVTGLIVGKNKLTLSGEYQQQLKGAIEH